MIKKWIKLKRFFSSKQKDTTNKSSLKSLSPNKKLRDGHYKQYENYLDDIITGEESSSINNIAITGKYGSGKSSIIDTYFSNKDNYLRVSFATFENSKKEDETPEGNIFANIINQIIYQVKLKKIPLTKFKVKKPISFFDRIIIILEIMSVVSLGINLNSLNIPDWVYAARISLIFIFGFRLLWLLFSKFEFSRFKLMYRNMESEIDMSRDDLFEKYTDEIIYLFKQSGKSILIIEDLDRFNKLEIFEKLRELNTKLNYSDKKHWQFIYLIKDSLFKDANDRVKFFDMIIPVIPFITSNNSFDKLRDEFPTNDIRLLQILGTYVDDYRLLLNIKNEFDVYKDKGAGGKSEKNELLSLITYKNLNPSEFDALQNGKGQLADIVEGYKNNIDKQVNEINQRIESLKRERDGASEGKETELLLVWAITNNLGYSKEKNYYISERISNLEDAKKIIKNNYWIGQYRSNNRQPYDKWKSSNPEYFNKLTAVIAYDDELKSLQMRRKTLKEKKFKSINKDVVENIDDLLFVLIKNEYITENYLNIINHYYGDPSNKLFMKNIYSENDDIDEEFHLTDIPGLLHTLQDDDFNKIQILNVDLIQYFCDKGDIVHLIPIINTAIKSGSKVIEKTINKNQADYEMFVKLKPSIQFDLTELEQNKTKDIIENNRYSENNNNELILIEWMLNEEINAIEILNKQNIYVSFKLMIIENLKNKIDIDDIDDKSLWISTLMSNKIKPTTKNISEYYKYDEGIDEVLIQFINNNVIEFNEKLPQEFYDDLMKHNDIENDKFECLWKQYNNKLIENIESLNSDKITILANLGVIEFGSEMISLFVKRGIRIPDNDINEKLIGMIFKNSMSLDHSNLISILKFNDDRSNIIFSRNLNVLSKSEIESYINKFGIENDKIRKIEKKSVGYKNLRLDNNEYVNNILNWMVTNKIIHNFEETSDGKLKVD